jgi:hypothetical protein
MKKETGVASGKHEDITWGPRTNSWVGGC